MDNKDNNQKEQKKFYIALYSTVALIAVTAVLISVSNKDTQQKTEYAADETTGGSAVEPVNKLNVKSYKEMTTQAVTTEPTTQSQSSTKTIANEEATTKKTTTAQGEYTLFDDNKEMLWPVDGKILMDYSMETAVYDKTLEQYRTNDSICISAHIGDSVLASADGVVEQVLNDNENGNTITVNHGNGWLSTYSQLGNNITVKEGQVVHQGDVLGCVGQPSKYNVALGAHLEFTVSKNNETTDPKLVLMQPEE